MRLPERRVLLLTGTERTKDEGKKREKYKREIQERKKREEGR